MSQFSIQLQSFYHSIGPSLHLQVASDFFEGETSKTQRFLQSKLRVPVHSRETLKNEVKVSKRKKVQGSGAWCYSASVWCSMGIDCNVSFFRCLSVQALVSTIISGSKCSMLLFTFTAGSHDVSLDPVFDAERWNRLPGPEAGRSIMHVRLVTRLQFFHSLHLHHTKIIMPLNKEIFDWIHMIQWFFVCCWSRCAPLCLFLTLCSNTVYVLSGSYP